MTVFVDDIDQPYEGPFWLQSVIRGVVERICEVGAVRNIKLEKARYLTGIPYEIDLLVRGDLTMSLEMGRFDALVAFVWAGGSSEGESRFGTVPCPDELVVDFTLRGFQYVEEEGGPDVIEEGEVVFTVTNRDKIAIKMGVIPPVSQAIADYIVKG